MIEYWKLINTECSKIYIDTSEKSKVCFKKSIPNEKAKKDEGKNYEKFKNLSEKVLL